MGGAAISKTLRSSGGTHSSLACEKGCPRQLSVNAGQLGRTYLPEIRPRAVLVTATGRQHDFGGGLHGRLARGNWWLYLLLDGGTRYSKRAHSGSLGRARFSYLTDLVPPTTIQGPPMETRFQASWGV